MCLKRSKSHEQEFDARSSSLDGRVAVMTGAGALGKAIVTELRERGTVYRVHIAARMSCAWTFQPLGNRQMVSHVVETGWTPRYPRIECRLSVRCPLHKFPDAEWNRLP